MNWTIAWHQILTSRRRKISDALSLEGPKLELNDGLGAESEHLIWCLLRCKMLLRSHIPSIGWWINELLIQNSKYLKSFFFYFTSQHKHYNIYFFIYLFVFSFLFSSNIRWADLTKWTTGLTFGSRALHEKWGWSDQRPETDSLAIDQLLFRYSNKEIKSQSHGGTRGSPKSTGQTVCAPWISKLCGHPSCRSQMLRYCIPQHQWPACEVRVSLMWFRYTLYVYVTQFMKINPAVIKLSHS